MTRDDPPMPEVRAGDEPERGNRCAPIRRTAAEELEGLFRFAMARSGFRPHVAEDVVQQALLIAMSHASPPGDVGRQRAWLRGIVHNVLRREARSGRRRRAAMDRATNLAPACARDAPPESDERRARLAESVHLAVTELDTDDQDLFYAFYRAGRSHACIARELGTTEKGVETRLYRLRARLRAALTRIGAPLP